MSAITRGQGFRRIDQRMLMGNPLPKLTFPCSMRGEQRLLNFRMPFSRDFGSNESCRALVCPGCGGHEGTAFETTELVVNYCIALRTARHTAMSPILRRRPSGLYGKGWLSLDSRRGRNYGMLQQIVASSVKPTSICRAPSALRSTVGRTTALE